jgi:hypothetical protein
VAAAKAGMAVRATKPPATRAAKVIAMPTRALVRTLLNLGNIRHSPSTMDIGHGSIGGQTSAPNQVTAHWCDGGRRGSSPTEPAGLPWVDQ